MNVLITEKFRFSSLIMFSSGETTGGDEVTIFFGPSVLPEPPSFSPLVFGAVERNQHALRKTVKFLCTCTT